MFHIKYFKIMKLYCSICIHVLSEHLVSSLDTTIRIHKFPVDRNILYLWRQRLGPSCVAFQDLLSPFLPNCQHLWLCTVFLDISNRNSPGGFTGQWYALQLTNKSMSRGQSNNLAMLSLTEVWVWDVIHKSPSPGRGMWGPPTSYSQPEVTLLEAPVIPGSA